MRMLPRRYAWLATLNSILAHQVAAQSCYYPNGDLAEGMAACSADGGACCPFQWECLSNGLCYLGNADYYGRYTCTDQSWSNSTCPGLCTQGNTASGNEAILQCADGSWCCDGNRSFDCCEEADAVFFDLPDGTSIAYISSVPSASSATLSSSEDTTEKTTTSSLVTAPTSRFTTGTPSEVAEASSTAQPSQTTSTTPTTSSSTSPSATEAPSTITSQAITTGTNGAASTLYIVSTVTPQPDPISTPNSNSSDDSSPTASPTRALIIGIAVGLPTLLLALSLLACLLWKRHHRRKPTKRNDPTTTTEYSQGDLDEKFGAQVGHLPPDGRAPELDSYPVAMVQRSPSGRKSELEGSPSTNTTVSSPAMSSLGGGETGGRTHFGGGGGGGQSSPLSPGLQSVREEQGQQQEPYELWGGYVPYRPPQSAQEVGKPVGGGYHGDEEKPPMWQ
ncbi:hypothetical protein NU219Hw_g3573t1 [Hortaea werneckii]